MSIPASKLVNQLVEVWSVKHTYSSKTNLIQKSRMIDHMGKYRYYIYQKPFPKRLLTACLAKKYGQNPFFLPYSCNSSWKVSIQQISFKTLTDIMTCIIIKEFCFNS